MMMKYVSGYLDNSADHIAYFQISKLVTHTLIRFSITDNPSKCYRPHKHLRYSSCEDWFQFREHDKKPKQW